MPQAGGAGQAETDNPVALVRSSIRARSSSVTNTFIGKSRFRPSFSLGFRPSSLRRATGE
jgi:hypothetical protein